MRTNSAETGPALKMEKVRKTYGEKTVLEGLSLEVGRGEIFGLIGENGAGKTTTIECALGTRKADSGSSAIRPTASSAIWTENTATATFP